MTHWDTLLSIALTAACTVLGIPIFDWRFSSVRGLLFLALVFCTLSALFNNAPYTMSAIMIGVPLILLVFSYFLSARRV